MNRNTFNTVSGLLLMMPLIAQAGIYQWVDEKGQVQFGDVPPQQQSEYKAGQVKLKPVMSTRQERLPNEELVQQETALQPLIRSTTLSTTNDTTHGTTHTTTHGTTHTTKHGTTHTTKHGTTHATTHITTHTTTQSVTHAAVLTESEPEKDVATKMRDILSSAFLTVFNSSVPLDTTTQNQPTARELETLILRLRKNGGALDMAQESPRTMSQHSTKPETVLSEMKSSSQTTDLAGPAIFNTAALEVGTAEDVVPVLSAMNAPVKAPLKVSAKTPLSVSVEEPVVVTVVATAEATVEATKVASAVEITIAAPVTTGFPSAVPADFSFPIGPEVAASNPGFPDDNLPITKVAFQLNGDNTGSVLDADKCGVFSGFVISYQMKVDDACPGAHCAVFKGGLRKYLRKQARYCGVN